MTNNNDKLKTLMSKVLWEMPVPSTSLTSDAKIHQMLKRVCVIKCSFEDINDNAGVFHIVFQQVEAFKCTYHNACTLEQISSYDKIIEYENTAWLTEVSSQLNQLVEKTNELKHLSIYFDDGPCFEFICKNFIVENIK